MPQTEEEAVDVEALKRRAKNLHTTLADAIDNPDRVWCKTCGRSEAVDAAECIKDGWPLCCGHTMTIDHPDTWA